MPQGVHLVLAGGLDRFPRSGGGMTPAATRAVFQA